jgi:excisionase family DNA binding protein
MTSDVHTLTIAEAATALDVAPATVRRWANKGRISVIRYPSGRMRIPQAELDRVLKPSETAAA